MAKKPNSVPAVSGVSGTVKATETEATTSTAMDQPAVSVDASASSPSPVELEPEAPSSPAEPAVVEPVVVEPVVEPVVEQKAGGGFSSPFAESKPAPTMVERIEALEARLAKLESK